MLMYHVVYCNGPILSLWIKAYLSGRRKAGDVVQFMLLLHYSESSERPHVWLDGH